MTIVAAAAILIVAIGGVVIFNQLVRARQQVREGWSTIDVQLKRRASLIPNLVETVQGYAAYERGTLERLTQARGALGAASGPGAAARADADLTGALHTLIAVAEAYPDLKASERFAALQRDLADTENRIAFARNYYNGAVELYNDRVQTFPGLLLARALGFQAAEFFSADDLRG